MNEATDQRTQSEAPVVELGERGPRGESGFLLRAPTATEALVWDLENEIVSARRLWIPEQKAWWVAMSYFDTVLDVVLRSFPAVRVLYSETSEERLLLAEGGPADTVLHTP
jgi:hypothetical protein